MIHYPDDVKQKMIAKMLPPNNASVTELAKQEGIPKATLYTWRIKHGNKNPQPKKEGTRSLNSTDKFSIIIETETMNEVEISEYCRRKGLYPKQIQDWKADFIQAYSGNPSKAIQYNLREKNKQIKGLESEIRRKEKALAEAAVLLILQKKVQAIWAEPEDEKLASLSVNK